MIQFEIGEKVKVYAEVGLMKKPKWIVGTYLDELPMNGAMVEVHGNKIISDIYRVKRYKRLEFKNGSCPEVDKFVATYWDTLKNIISAGFTHLLGPKAPKIEIDEEEKIISVQDGWISISPGIVERESIIEFSEHPTWSVSIAFSSHGTWDSPPDVDVSEIGECSNVVGAAELFVNTVWKENNRGFWESAVPYHD